MIYASNIQGETLDNEVGMNVTEVMKSSIMPKETVSKLKKETVFLQILHHCQSKTFEVFLVMPMGFR